MLSIDLRMHWLILPFERVRVQVSKQTSDDIYTQTKTGAHFGIGFDFNVERRLKPIKRFIVALFTRRSSAAMRCNAPRSWPNELKIAQTLKMISCSGAASIRWEEREKSNSHNLTFDFHGVHFTVTMRATAHIDSDWIWLGEHRQQMQCVFFLSL